MYVLYKVRAWNIKTLQCIDVKVYLSLRIMVDVLDVLTIVCECTMCTGVPHTVCTTLEGQELPVL